MGRTVKDLQQLIKDRATKKLITDLNDLQKLINDHPLIGKPMRGFADYKNIPQLGIVRKGEGEDKTIFQVPDDVFSRNQYSTFLDDSGYMGQLCRFWLPVYIERESIELLNRVDELKDQIDELFETKMDRGEAGY